MLSWRIFYVIERIGDVLNLETWSGCDDIKHGLRQLERELGRLHGYVMNVEAKGEEQLERFSPEISAIADHTDDILEGLPVYRNSTVKYPTSSKIEALLERINGFYMTNSLVANFNINTGNNRNCGGQLITGPVTVHYYNYPNSQPLVSRGATRQSYGHIQNREIVGFQSEVKTLLDHLIKNTQTRVVGIVGMGGCGKTTLAKHLYHHDEVKEHFVHKVWVCVSQSWNKRNILYEILRQTQGAQMNKIDFKDGSDEEFLEKVYQILSTKPYLIILDDIWTVRAWNEISQAFPTIKGSKVLVTSRNEVLPKLVDPAFFVLKPNLLNVKDSYELFCTRTFNNGVAPKDFEKLGKEMVDKCKGLPLAITALAGTLRVNMTLSHWTGICKKFSQAIMEAEDSTTYGVVKEVLALSYHDLPFHLKPFFLYLSIFPQNYAIKLRIWMRLWIVGGLISHDQLSEEQIEQTVTEYLDELTQRFLIQDVDRNYMGQVKAFQLHDLIREMCVEKAKEKGFLNESNRLVIFEDNRGQNRGPKKQFVEKVSSILDKNNMPRVQSITMIFRGNYCMLELDLSKYKFLRVLLFEGDTFSKLKWPQEAIENLIHLRYVGLRYMHCIPPQLLQKYGHLLTDDLGCYYGYLPEDLRTLERLRSLPFSPKYNELPLKLNKLRNLQILSITAGNWILSEMERSSPNLRHLWITDIRSQQQLEAVFCCPSLRLGNLQSLKLEWGMGIEIQNMEAFEQCDKLHELSLKGKMKESLNRVTLVVPPNLTKLELKYTQYGETDLMALLGNRLPRLKVLILGSKSYMGTKLTCKAGSFPELEQLVFTELPNLEEWDVERGAMPCLKDLTFRRCGKLDKFPEDWRFVSNIQKVKHVLMSDLFLASLLLWSEKPGNLGTVEVLDTWLQESGQVLHEILMGFSDEETLD